MGTRRFGRGSSARSGGAADYQYAMLTATGGEPLSRKAAKKRDDWELWKIAEEQEMKALGDMGVLPGRPIAACCNLKQAQFAPKFRVNFA